MKLTILSIRKLPKAKCKFAVTFTADGQQHRGTATIFPDKHHSVEFTEPDILGILFRSGRHARSMAAAIADAYRGKKLHDPIALDQPPEPTTADRLPLTVNAAKPMPLRRVG